MYASKMTNIFTQTTSRIEMRVIKHFHIENWSINTYKGMPYIRRFMHNMTDLCTI